MFIRGKAIIISSSSSSSTTKQAKSRRKQQQQQQQQLQQLLLVQYYYYSTTTTVLLLQYYYYSTTTTVLLLQYYYYSTTTTVLLLLLVLLVNSSTGIHVQLGSSFLTSIVLPPSLLPCYPLSSPATTITRIPNKPDFLFSFGLFYLTPLKVLKNYSIHIQVF